MSLRTIGRKVKMDILQQDGDVCKLLFSNRRAQHACLLFLDDLRAKNGLTRAEIQRQCGVIKAARAYNRLFRAYVGYLKFRVAFLEQQLKQAEGK